MTAEIFDIQRFSLFDGPGVRTVVFFKGCPLRCVWCHNPEGLAAGPQLMYDPDKCIGCGECVKVCGKHAHLFEDGMHVFDASACVSCGKCADACCARALTVAGRKVELCEVVAEVLKDISFYRESGGGVTLSGGEPLRQSEFAVALLEEMRKQGVSSCVETCGMADTSALVKAAEYADLFYYDYKATGDAMHRNFCGADQTQIIHNLARLDEIGAKVVLRCPIIPGANMCDEHIAGIARTAAEYGCIGEVRLAPYHKLGLGKARKLGITGMFAAEPPSHGDMVAFCASIEKASGKKCTISR